MRILLLHRMLCVASCYVSRLIASRGGTPDRSASSPARRISGVRPPGKIAFLENITGPSHRPRELLLDLVQPQPPPFVSALLYHIQADPPDIVYSYLVEGPLDE